MNRIIQPLNVVLSLALLLLAVGPVLADGMVVPVRPEHRVRGTWTVKYHHVNMTVRDQVASVSIDQQFAATGNQTVEVEYLFPVPPDAAIDSMTLIVDGKEMPAKLLEADEARKIYEDIVRRKKDPALLEYVGFGMYKTSAFPLEPGKPAKVVVTYKDVCKKDSDIVRVWYPLNTEKFSAKPIESVKVRVDIKTDADITSVYSPSHDINIDRKDPRHVIASYEAKNELPTTDFQVFYRAADEKVGATFLTHQASPGKDGHFMLMVSPNPRASSDKIVPKDVVMVLDHSGSMSGEKIIQAREAVQFMLRNLNKKDRFNVIAYSSDTEAFFDGLVKASPENVKKAVDMIDRIEARGGTNIDGALTEAMELFENSKRPGYLLFMTDGLPTVGETSETKILAHAKDNNDAKARVFAFGVGYDVNIRLLDKLVRENRGKSDYVKPNEPIEEKVSALYRKIKNPVMTELAIKVAGLKLRHVHPREPGDLFEGDQILMVGRYDAEEAKRLAASGDGRHTTLIITGMYAGKEQTFEYPVKVCKPGPDMRYAFVRELWAVRQVGYLLDQIQLHGQEKELVDEIVALAVEHGIITPYTSFLADERTNLARRDRLRERASEEALVLKQVTGGQGQMNADNRASLNEAERPQKATAPGEGKMYFGNTDQDAFEAGEEETADNMRQVGNTTLYRRGNQWIEAGATKVDLEKDADKIKDVKQYSDAYFALVRDNTVEQNRVLASQQPGEELFITLRGQTYRIY